MKGIIEEQGINVICPDIPGFKPQTELKEPWNLDNYIDWFSEFVKKEQKKNPRLAGGFFLLGHSFGGRLTIKIASQNLFNLKGIILVSAAGIRRDTFFHKEIMALLAKLVEAFKLGQAPIIKDIYNFLRIFFYHYIIRKTDYLNAKGALHDTIKNILAEDLKDRLDKISVPTKIIWGDKDKITPLRDAYSMKEKIKNSELEILENIKHTPYTECPEKLANSIIRFIKK